MAPALQPASEAPEFQFSWIAFQVGVSRSESAR